MKEARPFSPLRKSRRSKLKSGTLVDSDKGSACIVTMKEEALGLLPSRNLRTKGRAVMQRGDFKGKW